MWKLLGMSLSLCVVVMACSGSKENTKKDETVAAPAATEAVAQPCDLFAQTCPAGQACTVVVGGQPSCIPAGAGADGAACQTSNECGTGLVCTPEGCRGLCNPAHACKAGSCVEFTNMPTLPGLGACSLGK